MNMWLKKFTQLPGRWSKNQDGATAIEFALLGVPFMLMVVGIIEMSLMFLAGCLLEGSVQDAARQIRTGQLQTMGGSENDQRNAFLQAVCDNAGMMMKCANFQYQVLRVTSFTDDISPKFNEDGTLKDDKKFDLDDLGSCEVAVIRVMYNYPLLTPLLSSAFANGPNNTRVLMSTTAFEVEPFQAGTSKC